jgi:ubiquinone/menaquinone biosynthesis C-methylase UbiE
MTTAPAEYFDRIAPRYDNVWSCGGAGRLQREAVWRYLDELVRPGGRVLDVGCGTGEDAVRMMQRGARVVAIDASAEMVRIARSKGVDARQHPLERLAEIEGVYDLLLSNFGPINCTPNLATLRDALARLVRPGGMLAICMMSRFCLRETAHYALRGQFRKAVRRWTGVSRVAGDWTVFYPSRRAICRALASDFSLRTDAGIGICVPPSFVKPRPERLLSFFSHIDAQIGAAPLFRSIGDHRLLIFTRI